MMSKSFQLPAPLPLNHEQQESSPDLLDFLLQCPSVDHILLSWFSLGAF